MGGFFWLVLSWPYCYRGCDLASWIDCHRGRGPEFIFYMLSGHCPFEYMRELWNREWFPFNLPKQHHQPGPLSPPAQLLFFPINFTIPKTDLEICLDRAKKY